MPSKQMFVGTTVYLNINECIIAVVVSNIYFLPHINRECLCCVRTGDNSYANALCAFLLPFFYLEDFTVCF